MWKKALLVLAVVAGTQSLAGCVVEPIGYGRGYYAAPVYPDYYAPHPHYWGYYGR